MARARIKRIADLPIDQWYTKQTGGCWRWRFSLNSKGYGYVVIDGVQQRATHAVYKQLVGPIPKGTQLNHRCDHSWCVNPKHLYPGNQKQNMQDRASRSWRPPRGHSHHASVLTETQADWVRRSYQPRIKGRTIRDLANRLGTSITPIFRAIHSP